MNTTICNIQLVAVLIVLLKVFIISFFFDEIKESCMTIGILDLVDLLMFTCRSNWIGQVILGDEISKNYLSNDYRHNNSARFIKSYKIKIMIQQT